MAQPPSCSNTFPRHFCKILRNFSQKNFWAKFPELGGMWPHRHVSVGPYGHPCIKVFSWFYRTLKALWGSLSPTKIFALVDNISVPIIKGIGFKLRGYLLIIKGESLVVLNFGLDEVLGGWQFLLDGDYLRQVGLGLHLALEATLARDVRNRAEIRVRQNTQPIHFPFD